MPNPLPEEIHLDRNRQGLERHANHIHQDCLVDVHEDVREKTKRLLDRQRERDEVECPTTCRNCIGLKVSAYYRLYPGTDANQGFL